MNENFNNKINDGIYSKIKKLIFKNYKEGFLLNEESKKQLFNFINCGNYELFNLYLSHIKKILTEINNDLCFNIIIDYTKQEINIIIDYEKSFDYKVKKILTNNSSNNLQKISFIKKIFFLQNFKEITKNNKEIDNIFLKFYNNSYYFKKNNIDISKLTHEEKIKYIIGFTLIKILRKNNIYENLIINSKKNNSVLFRLKNNKKIELNIGLDPKIKIETIGGRQLRYNGFLKEEIEKIINDCNLFFRKEIEKIISNNFSKIEKLTIEHKREIKKTKGLYYEKLIKSFFEDEKNY